MGSLEYDRVCSPGEIGTCDRLDKSSGSKQCADDGMSWGLCVAASKDGGTDSSSLDAKPESSGGGGADGEVDETSQGGSSATGGAGGAEAGIDGKVDDTGAGGVDASGDSSADAWDSAGSGGGIAGGAGADSSVTDTGTGGSSGGPDSALDVAVDTKPDVADTGTAADTGAQADAGADTIIDTPVDCPTLVENCTNGIDDNCDGKTDCADPQCNATGISCISSVPAGWTGYRALFEGKAADDPGCPASYPSNNTPAYLGNTGLSFSPAQCTCTCDAPQGESCVLPGKITVSDAPCGQAANCGKDLETPTGWNGSCWAPDSYAGSTCGANAGATCTAGSSPCAVSVSAPAPTVTGGACTPHGPQKTVSPPAFSTLARACGDPVSAGKGCDVGQTCLAKPKAPFANGVCVYKDGDNACPVGDFSQKHVYYQGTTDTRECAASLDVFIMLDQSGSMSGTRWDSVVTAINSFVDSPSAAGIGVGLGLFSYPGTTSCDVAVYATPRVAIATLPGNSAAIKTTIAATSPTTNTPTRPALEGSLQYAKTYSLANPGHKVVVVLATDGEPNGCTPTCTIANTAAVAAAGLADTPSIPTYVIGVGTSTGNLATIASAGGTGAPYMVTSGSSAAFLAAMEDVRQKEIGSGACACGSPSGSTCSANIMTYTDSCSTAPLTFKAGTCENITGNPIVAGRSAVVTPPSGASCLPSTSQPTGAVLGKTPMTFCCIP